MNAVISKNGVTIRLTDERWAHITDEHCELAGLRFEILETITDPNKVFHGSLGELIAVREVQRNKFLAVVYKEFKQDGFIITAFLTRKIKSFIRRKQAWPN